MIEDEVICAAVAPITYIYIIWYSLERPISLNTSYAYLSKLSLKPVQVQLFVGILHTDLLFISRNILKKNNDSTNNLITAVMDSFPQAVW